MTCIHPEWCGTKSTIGMRPFAIPESVMQTFVKGAAHFCSEACRDAARPPAPPERVGPVAASPRLSCADCCHAAVHHLTTGACAFVACPCKGYLPMESRPVDPPAPASAETCCAEAPFCDHTGVGPLPKRAAETGPKLSDRMRDVTPCEDCEQEWSDAVDEVAALEARLQEAERVMLAYVTRAEDAERERDDLLRTLEHSATHKALDALAIENGKLRQQLAEVTRPHVDAEAVRRELNALILEWHEGVEHLYLADAILAKFHVTPRSK